MTKATQESTAASDGRKEIEFAVGELTHRLIDSIKQVDAIITGAVLLAAVTRLSANGVDQLRQLVIVLAGASTEMTAVSADLQNALKAMRR